MAIAVLASAGTGWAQSVGGGVKIGVNFATVSSDDDEDDDFSTRTGIIAGGFLTVPAGGMVAFQPEVLYSMQGATFDEDGAEITAEVDEIQIPLLLRLGRKSAHFLVGPSIGFITRAKFTSDDDFEEDFKDDLKSTDIGLVVGAGVTVNRFLVEARYTAGMTNLNEDDDEENKSRVFSVLVGVGF